MSNVFKGDCQRDSWSCLCFLPSQALLCPILHQPKAVVRDNVLYLQASLQSEMPHSSVVSCRKVKKGVGQEHTQRTAHCKNLSLLFLSLEPWSCGYRKCIAVAREHWEPKIKLSPMWRWHPSAARAGPELSLSKEVTGCCGAGGDEAASYAGRSEEQWGPTGGGAGNEKRSCSSTDIQHLIQQQWHQDLKEMSKLICSFKGFILILYWSRRYMCIFPSSPLFNRIVCSFAPWAL